jgi:hypothetical protein
MSSPAEPSTHATTPSSITPDDVHAFVEKLLGDDVHARRVHSLADGVVGVLHTATLGIHAIGLGLAEATGKDPKYATKQFDRLLSNKGLDLPIIFRSWAPFLVRERQEVVVALDWTDHDADDQTTCMLSLVTDHGRTTPMIWKTVRKSELAGRQFATESEVIERAHQSIPPSVEVTLLADRGFGSQDRYAMLTAWGWDWVIRFRGNIQVHSDRGVTRTAAEWVPEGGRARMLHHAAVTADRSPVPAVVLVHRAKMKEPWCLATSRADLSAAAVIALYGRRFSIEENFRDTKDPRFGLGLSSVRISDCGRRDRLLLMVSLAEALLTLLGAASERVGLDKRLYVGTSKKRVHSLFTQGRRWFQLLPTLREEWLRPLMTAFGQILMEHQVTREIFSVL